MFLQTSLNWGPNFSPPNYTSWLNLVRPNAGHRDQHIVAIHPFLLSKTHPKTPPILCPTEWDPEKNSIAPGAENQLAPDLMVSISDEGWKIATSLEGNENGHRAKDLPDSTTPRQALMWELGSLHELGATPFRAIYFSHRSLKPKEDPTKNAGVCNWEHTHKSPTPSCAATWAWGNLSLKPTLGYPGVYTPKWTRDCSPKQQMPCLEVGWIPPKMAM